MKPNLLLKIIFRVEITIFTQCDEILRQRTMQCETDYNFKRQIPNDTNTQVSILTYTRGLGIHSKMCATQMDTRDNPVLWVIQLSTWLF